MFNAAKMNSSLLGDAPWAAARPSGMGHGAVRATVAVGVSVLVYLLRQSAEHQQPSSVRRGILLAAGTQIGTTQKYAKPGGRQEKEAIYAAAWNSKRADAIVIWLVTPAPTGRCRRHCQYRLIASARAGRQRASSPVIGPATRHRHQPATSRCHPAFRKTSPDDWPDNLLSRR